MRRKYEIGDWSRRSKKLTKRSNANDSQNENRSIIDENSLHQIPERNESNENKHYVTSTTLSATTSANIVQSKEHKKNLYGLISEKFEKIANYNDKPMSKATYDYNSQQFYGKFSIFIKV